jgi:hypothetical protein
MGANDYKCLPKHGLRNSRSKNNIASFCLNRVHLGTVLIVVVVVGIFVVVLNRDKSTIVCIATAS